MIYKRYELSQSLNGNNIMHIARNAAGMVVFRENSQKQLQTAIDNYLNNLEKERQEKIKAAQVKAKPKNPKKKSELPRKKHFWG